MREDDMDPTAHELDELERAIATALDGMPPNTTGILGPTGMSVGGSSLVTKADAIDTALAALRAAARLQGDPGLLRSAVDEAEHAALGIIHPYDHPLMHRVFQDLRAALAATPAEPEAIDVDAIQIDHMAHALAQEMPGYFTYPDDSYLAHRLLWAFVARRDHYARLSNSAQRETPEWKGPGPRRHSYSPDHQAMGDCKVCGHVREDHAASAQRETPEGAVE